LQDAENSVKAMEQIPEDYSCTLFIISELREGVMDGKIARNLLLMI
jgi:hypothetical protein